MMQISVASRAIPRSVLYTSALDPQRLAKALCYDSDLFLIDLEDSVPKHRKEHARNLCRNALAESPALKVMAVRINPMHSMEVYQDLTMLLSIQTRPYFLFMTMVENASEVDCLRRSLADAGWYPQIYATIETVSAIQNIALLATKLDGMILGSADLSATLGVPISEAALIAARQAMVLASANEGIGCLDTGNFQLNNPELLTLEIAKAKEMGFHGKGTVHPKELSVINEAFRPNKDEYIQARRIVETAEATEDAVFLLDGAMVGPPFVRRAKKLLADHSVWHSYFGNYTKETVK